MNPSETIMLRTRGNDEALQRSLNLLNKVGKTLEKLSNKIECQSTSERTDPAVEERLAKASRDISNCKIRLTRIRSKLEKVIYNKFGLKEDLVKIMMIKSDLDTEAYDCPICLVPIAIVDAIWTCKTCHNILHLLCIWKHARATIENGDGLSWNCPICRHEVHTPPSSLYYFCFCGGTTFPRAVPGRTAHGCGQRCRKMPGCTLTCHPALCPV